MITSGKVSLEPSKIFSPWNNWSVFRHYDCKCPLIFQTNCSLKPISSGNSYFLPSKLKLDSISWKSAIQLTLLMAIDNDSIGIIFLLHYISIGVSLK